MQRLLPRPCADQCSPAEICPAPQVALPTFILVPVAPTAEQSENLTLKALLSRRDHSSTVSKDATTAFPASKKSGTSSGKRKRGLAQEDVCTLRSAANDSKRNDRCKRCKKSTADPCLVHSYAIKDSSTIPRAYYSIPAELYIAQKNGMTDQGVFTKTLIFHPTVFGPLVAPSSKSDFPTDYRFALSEKNGKSKTLPVFDLDCDDLCNWMKFVRDAVDDSQKNLTAFCENGCVYFATTKDIPIDTELRFWYSKQYAKTMKKPILPHQDVFHQGYLPENDENEIGELSGEDVGFWTSDERNETKSVSQEQYSKNPEQSDHDGSLSPSVQRKSIVSSSRKENILEDETEIAAEEVLAIISRKALCMRRYLRKPSARLDGRSSHPCTAGCKMRFKRKITRDIHHLRHQHGDLKLVTDQHPAVCPECDVDASSWSALIDHVEHSHLTLRSVPRRRRATSRSASKELLNSEEKYPCDILGCSFIFRSEALRNLHAYRHDGAEGNESDVSGGIPSLTCPGCNIPAGTLRDLLSHVERLHAVRKRLNKNHTDEKVPVHLRHYVPACASCKSEFMSVALRDLHSLQHGTNLDSSTQTVRQCPACSFSTDEIYELIKHVDDVHCRKASNKCPRCCRSFTSLKRLEVHIQRHHIWSNSERPFECSVCQKKFTENSSFSRHMKMHDGFNYIKCPICPEAFRTRNMLNDHLFKLHCVNGMIQCPFCPKQYSSEAMKRFRYHIVWHSQQGEFECEICKKTFASKKHLARHIQGVHSVSRDYVCECGKSYNDQHRLTQHKRLVHRAGKVDMRKAAKHEKTGTIDGGKRKGYVAPQKLKDYTEFPYSCEVCRQGFVRRGMMAYHFTVRHPERSLESVPQLVFSSSAVY